MARLSLSQERDKLSKERRAKYLSKKADFSTFRKVWHYAAPNRGYMYLTFIFDLLNSLAELLIPIFMGYAINCAVGAGRVDFNGLTINVLIMLGLVLVAALFNWLGSLTINAFAYKASYTFRDLFFKKINSVPLNFIDTNSHGDLLSRMVNDIDLICDGFLESIA